jgi:hypothetical protein
MFALCSSTAITAKQASASVRREYLHLANLETHLVVGAPAAAVAQLGVVLWHELGSDAGVDDAAAEALADRLTRAGQQAPGAAALVTEQAPVPALGSLPSWTTSNGSPPTLTDCS